MIKRDYQSFHQVFEQRAQFKSHLRRITHARGSSYNNQGQSKILDEKTEFQLRLRKRNHEIQEQELSAKNEYMSQRLKSIQSTEPRLQLNDMKIFSSRKQFQQKCENEILKQNSRFKLRLLSIESQFNKKSLEQDYLKHQITLERMQRFKKKNNKCVLKSLERIEHCEQQSQQKIKKQYYKILKTEPDRESNIDKSFIKIKSLQYFD